MTQPTARTVVFALCGSFCSIDTVLPQIQRLTARGWQVMPVLSVSAATQDTRFGTAAELRAKLEALTGRVPLDTLQQVEPLGPRRLADAMVIAPAACWRRASAPRR